MAFIPLLSCADKLTLREQELLSRLQQQWVQPGLLLLPAADVEPEPTLSRPVPPTAPASSKTGPPDSNHPPWAQ